jgi:RHS repeat-associated protein
MNLYDENGAALTPTVTKYYFGGAYEVRADNSVVKYYSFGGTTIMRDDTGELHYMLTDHLGSVVAVTNSAGTLESEQRYLPFGQVRADVGTIAQTDYGYTGQRALDSGMGGIMDYKARFYSPMLGRFLQPDSIVPNAASPQNFNRYSYVGNNPIMRSDPSGHKCVGDDPECIEGENSNGGISAGGLRVIIENRYEWDLGDEEWSDEDLRLIYETGNDIERYVDNLTGGKGLEWMNKNMTGANISIGWFSRGSSFAGNIKLPYDFGNDPLFSKYYLAHELAHLWDARSGGENTPLFELATGSNHWFEHGPSDSLNALINGTVAASSGCRWCDGSGKNYIPSDYQFKTDPMTMNGEPYANNSTADYFAETFALSVYANEYSSYSFPVDTIPLYMNLIINQSLP